jgi:glutaredoxin
LYCLSQSVTHTPHYGNSKKEVLFLAPTQHIGIRIHGGIFSVTDAAKINIYTLENCPNCELLKEYLDEAGIGYSIRNMMEAEALTELRINGVFVREAPVFQIGTTFLISKDLFGAEGVRGEVLESLLRRE